METDGDRSEIPGVAPAALAAGGFFGISYDFVISRDLLRFQRDDFQVTVFVEIEPGVPHTYRLELHGADEYFVYIDGEEINSGVPGGQYPSDEHDVMAWRAKAWFLPNTTQWDYVRIGTTPQVGSGDFDSDGEVDFDDLPFFQALQQNSWVQSGGTSSAVSPKPPPWASFPSRVGARAQQRRGRRSLLAEWSTSR